MIMAMMIRFVLIKNEGYSVLFDHSMSYCATNDFKLALFYIDVQNDSFKKQITDFSLLWVLMYIPLDNNNNGTRFICKEEQIVSMPLRNFMSPFPVW